MGHLMSMRIDHIFAPVLGCCHARVREEVYQRPTRPLSPSPQVSDLSKEA
jgi:hypothetical protein